MGYDITFFGVGLGSARLHFAKARAGAVAGVQVDVERPETVRAVITRGVTEGGNGAAAVSAGKCAVVFYKAFVFYIRHNNATLQSKYIQHLSTQKETPARRQPMPNERAANTVGAPLIPFIL